MGPDNEYKTLTEFLKGCYVFQEDSPQMIGRICNESIQREMTERVNKKFALIDQQGLDIIETQNENH